jgi:hypothetical protein
MSKLTVLVAIPLALSAHALAQSADSSIDDLPQVVIACNSAASSDKPRAMRACETLEKAGRLSLVEPAAVAAYQRYQQERLAACQRRQASPRGQSRGASECG